MGCKLSENAESFLRVEYIVDQKMVDKGQWPWYKKAKGKS